MDIIFNRDKLNTYIYIYILKTTRPCNGVVVPYEGLFQENLSYAISALPSGNDRPANAKSGEVYVASTLASRLYFSIRILFRLVSFSPASYFAQGNSVKHERKRGRERERGRDRLVAFSSEERIRAKILALSR